MQEVMIYGGVNTAQDLNDVLFWHADPASSKREAEDPPASGQLPTSEQLLTSDQLPNPHQPPATPCPPGETAPPGTTPSTDPATTSTHANGATEAPPPARSTAGEPDAGGMSHCEGGAFCATSRHFRSVVGCENCQFFCLGASQCSQMPRACHCDCCGDIQ